MEKRKIGWRHLVTGIERGVGPTRRSWRVREHPSADLIRSFRGLVWAGLITSEGLPPKSRKQASLPLMPKTVGSHLHLK